MKRLLFILFAVVVALSGCKSAQPTPTETKIETRIEYRDRVTRDTTYIKDSVFIRERADTVFVDRYRLQYVERVRVDTAYCLNTDSVYIERVEYVERKRTKYDKITSGGFWLLLLLLSLCIYLKFKNED